MTQSVSLAVLLVVGLVWTGIWLWVMRSARNAAPFDPIYKRVGSIRRWGLYGIGGVAIVALGVSIWQLPYPGIRTITLGEPVEVVDVAGHQWHWVLSDDELPLGVPVEFRVTSMDVHHSFGLYDPNGVLVAQVQSIPDRVTRLIYTFTTPGEYEILCLELCGVAHHAMRSQITVLAAAPMAPGAVPPADPAPQEPAAEVPTETLMAEGEPLYAINCGACHGAQGQGGLAAALIQSPVVSSVEGLIRQILLGSPQAGMPPFAHLDDGEIAAIATFVRNSWGNSDGPVQPAAVADVRAALPQ